MAVHQCTRFSIYPRVTDERAVMSIGKFLLGIRNRGIKLNPDISRCIECFDDTDFAGNWDKVDAGNPENVLFRTGYISIINGCPVTWASKLQIEIVLPTIDAEYTAMSQSTRQIIPLVNLIKELNSPLDFGMKNSDLQYDLYE